jgi:hypothetical protein
LLENNIDAYNLWMLIKTQWRVSGVGVVGLDYNVIYLECNRLEIDLSNCLMAKIRALEKFELSRDVAGLDRKSNAGKDKKKRGALQGGK